LATEPSGRRCGVIGYAAFVARQADESFATWFHGLRCQVTATADTTAPPIPRLAHIQHALVDVFAILDPQHLRADANLLKKLPVDTEA
jgi:hypothetical protein